MPGAAASLARSRRPAAPESGRRSRPVVRRASPARGPPAAAARPLRARTSGAAGVAAQRGGVLADQEADHHRAPNPARIAPQLAAMLLEHRELLAVVGQGHAADVPLVRVAGDDAERTALALAADQQRRVRALDRARRAAGILQRVDLALEVGRVLRPERLD